MGKISVRTVDSVTPMIYAYSTPEIRRHDGWTKIGYTEQDVATRIHQQTHTADVKYKEEWRGNAVFEDGSYEVFSDLDFHAYLQKLSIRREPHTEWFEISGRDSRNAFYDFKSNRGDTAWQEETVAYKLREEQARAVHDTVVYHHDHTNGEYLWNAKPRFGKTLSVYGFCKQIDAQNVLIVTNRPAIANSWYADYVRFLGKASGYLFVSTTDSLKTQSHVISREEYIRATREEYYKCITFLSLQDLKGSLYFGGKFDKLKWVGDVKWDVLVIDEAHEGVDTSKTDRAFDHIDRRFTLHLSGTPFKALANDKFPDGAIFNWTYADEQYAKEHWDASSEQENPYENLPKLNLFTYQMSEIVRDELDRGIEIQGETEEYAFDLGEFFSTDAKGRFVHGDSVDKFLDALTTQEKYPFSTPELRKELKHTFWLLNRVSSAEALAKKLKNHPVFQDYTIVLAAGDGRMEDDSDVDAETVQKSFDKVKAAIASHDKTITLSVGQLTTGVTIPEWTAVLMLSNIKSPALYMQAAFRAQNPCLFHSETAYYRKTNAYVFDFDPARTLMIYEQFANDLNQDTAQGKGDTQQHKDNIMRLLNFFPVIGEDDEGEMIALDAEKVLSIPRKIKAREVVRRGFMSNYLFQNITNIFNGAPSAVTDILSQFPPVPQPQFLIRDTAKAEEELSLDADGNVQLDEGFVIGTAQDVFGDKIFAPVDDIVSHVGEAAEEEKEHPTTPTESDAADKLKQELNEKVTQSIIDTVSGKYGSDLRPSVKKGLERKLTGKATQLTEKVIGNYQIEKNVIEQQRSDALKDRFNTGKTTAEIDAIYDELQEKALTDMQSTLSNALEDYIATSTQEAINTVETDIREQKKATIEDAIRDHLRGFTRTIPSFLMAYGSEVVTLDNFDSIIPDNVFLEVTSVTLNQFRFLRDGGDYTDPETGEIKHFNGNLFEPIVFNDAVKEFLRLKKELGNYFDESHEEDIFDYIPPQKTNQIYTPKKVVKRMVALLEKEEPGCFDRDDKTFIDLYMKSGLYITEIVKRLYNSEKIKALYPDSIARLDHIFEKQVYGLAPTEIIYNIAKNFILGFDEAYTLNHHNFRQCDALIYAKAGTLSQKLDELFDGGAAVEAPKAEPAKPAPAKTEKIAKTPAEPAKTTPEKPKTPVQRDVRYIRDKATEKDADHVFVLHENGKTKTTPSGQPEKQPAVTPAPKAESTDDLQGRLQALLDKFKKL